MTRTATGASIVEGIGVGRAVVWRDHPAPRPFAGTLPEERARLRRGIAAAKRGLNELVRLLPRAEVELFEPELLLIDELGESLEARLQEGERAEDAICGATVDAPGDLFLDARARVLDAIAHDQRTVESHLDNVTDELVLVTDALTPSVVASLPPRVVAIVAASPPPAPHGLGTSHAAILARGRDIPLAALAAGDLANIAADARLVVDTTAPEAHVTIDPSDAQASDADARLRDWTHARAEAESLVASPLEHLGVEILANVGSLRERVPPSAEGIGLLRTEILFADHEHAPSEAEQFGTLCAIAAGTPRGAVVVRLFDAGADKPLPWLAPREGSPALRGFALLAAHPEVLETQLRALLRARGHGDFRVMVPYVERASDVAAVRAGLRGALPVGALVETPEAVARIEDIAKVSDFVSIGTNDLAACVSGEDRAQGGLSFDPAVLALIERALLGARAEGRRVCVCGEMAGDAHGARVLVGLGAQALSVAPARAASIKLALRTATLEDCRAIARAALGGAGHS